MLGRALVGLALLAGSARAAPAVELAVTGDCPSKAQMEQALLPFAGIVDGGERWIVEVKPGATLALRDPTGAIVVTREIASTDCQALADAFAVIVHGQFVELKLLPAPAIVETPREPRGRALPVRPIVVDTPRMWVATIAGGLAVSGSEAMRSGTGQLDVTWGARWQLRAGASFDTPITLASDSDRVRLARATTHLDVGYFSWAAHAFWLRPMVGAGVAAWRVDPMDLPNASPTWHVQPLATAGLALGFPLAQRVGLRFEAAATTFLVKHRYVVDPEGVVARSPRGAVATSAGLQWRFW